MLPHVAAFCPRFPVNVHWGESPHFCHDPVCPDPPLTNVVGPASSHMLVLNLSHARLSISLYTAKLRMALLCLSRPRLEAGDIFSGWVEHRWRRAREGDFNPNGKHPLPPTP